MMEILVQKRGGKSIHDWVVTYSLMVASSNVGGLVTCLPSKDSADSFRSDGSCASDTRFAALVLFQSSASSWKVTMEDRSSPMEGACSTTGMASDTGPSTDDREPSLVCAGRLAPRPSPLEEDDTEDSPLVRLEDPLRSLDLLFERN